jgi:hypothetical protein
MLWPRSLRTVEYDELLFSNPLGWEHDTHSQFPDQPHYPLSISSCHQAVGPGDPSRAFGIQIVTLAASASGLRIADVTTFLDPWFVTSFGFPHELPG